MLKRNEIECGKELIEMENKIYSFVNRLEHDEYKVILYNNQTPILADDLGIIELIRDDLTEESTIELNDDIMVIHTDIEKVELKGYKEMSDGEIFARQYLDRCEDTIIIKDNEEQIEMREDNFHESKDFYEKCKEIVNIRKFIGDESDRTYRMNWDCLWMTYRNGNRELWQRA